MGPTGLTAVFGMGTGVTPPVWSPRIPTPGDQALRRIPRWIGHDESIVSITHTPWALWARPTTLSGSVSCVVSTGRSPPLRFVSFRGGPIGVVKLLGC